MMDSDIQTVKCNMYQGVASCSPRLVDGASSPPYLVTSRPRAAAVRAALASNAPPQALDLELLQLLELLDLAKTPRHRQDGVGHSLRRSRMLQSTAMFPLQPVVTCNTDMG